MPGQSKFFEQFAGKLLDELGCQIQTQPTVGNQNKADFLATTPDGDRFYVEATEVQSSQYPETPLENDVTEKLNEMCHDSGIYWYIQFVKSGELRQHLAKKDLLPIKEWVEGLSTEEPKIYRQTFACLDRAVQGVNARCRPFSYRDDCPRDEEWVIDIKAMPRSEHMRRVESPMFPGFGKSGAVDSVGPLVRAIRAKALQYRAVEEPLLLAINDKSRFPSNDIAATLALFGWEQDVAKGVCRITPPIGMQKRRSAWGGGKNTRSSAVLLFTELTQHSLPYQEVCLYENPWARYPISRWLKRTFPYARIEEKSGNLFLHRPSERHLNSVRGLPVKPYPRAELLRVLNENARLQWGVF
ncbi:MAG: hypothetical protein OXI53_08905 [Nitrospira sp.]|nr:hypothetical protein [Nitrospira sp.]MDE0405415.1 hypothetical protein [Nitrospira sp.]MDE0504603.1 hypothetical protein [Candidatus Poribacteria bacterium]